MQREGQSQPRRAAASVSNNVVGNFFAAMMILKLLLVFLDLPFKPVDQVVHCSVEIFVDRFDENILAREVNGDLSLLLQLLHRKNHIHADDVVEVTGDPLELAGDVFANGRRDFKVVSTDLQVHGVAPLI